MSTSGHQGQTDAAPTENPPVSGADADQLQPSLKVSESHGMAQEDVQTGIAAEYSHNTPNDQAASDQTATENQTKAVLPSSAAHSTAGPSAALQPVPTQEVSRVSTDVGSSSVAWPAAAEAVQQSTDAVNADPTSATWNAAREDVLHSIGSEHKYQDASLHHSGNRGRGRPRRANFPNGDRASHIDTTVPLDVDQPATTPIRRGRGGRNRRKGVGRRKSKSSKKKGGDGTDGDLTDSDAFSDESAGNKDPIVTKSGRSVTKPSQYNPVAEPSPSSGTKRKRSSQLQQQQPPKFVDQIWCVKCSRGHSPPSNQIVLCDGCDAAYHQWCHDPLIEKHVAENINESWFCGNCLHNKEVQNLPIEQRMAGGNLSLDERFTYLSLLPKPTLVALLMHSASLHSELPLFAPNTREILSSMPKSNILHPQNNAPYANTAVSQSMQDASSAMNHPTQQFSQPISNFRAQGQGPTYQQRDPYPEYSNEAGDPPATYPRPGRGPIKLQSTTHPEDYPWMVQDNYEVFSHLIDDGSGRLVSVQQRPEGWATGMRMAAQNGNAAPQNYQQHMYTHPPPPPQHMAYASQMMPPHHHPQHTPTPQQQFQGHPDMQQRQQWSPTHNMSGNDHMQHQQQQHQQTHPGQHGAIVYGGSLGMQ